MPDSAVRLPRLLTPSTHRGVLWRLGIPLLLWCGALALTLVLHAYIQRSAFTFFWIAVLGAAWFTGMMAAIVAAVASVLAVNYIFVPPAWEFNLTRLGSAEAIQLAIFLIASSLVSMLLQRLETARLRLIEDRAVQEELTVRLQHQAEALEDQAMELERQNEELQELAEAATTANRAKAEFLATMSHELRTPINAAMGYVDLLEAELRGPINDAQRADLVRIRRSQRRLLTLVTDVLSFARLESARLELRLEIVALETLLPELDEIVSPLAHARRITYQCTPPAEPLRVRADRDRLEQVLLNLLGNAVKFTEAGGSIRVGAERQNGRAIVCVEDTGRGIPADKLDAIFEPFVQVDQALTRTTEGTGLGLAISRGLARAMGGDVTVTSTPGAGSTFMLWLPLLDTDG